MWLMVFEMLLWMILIMLMTRAHVPLAFILINLASYLILCIHYTGS